MARSSENNNAPEEKKEPEIKEPEVKEAKISLLYDHILDIPHYNNPVEYLDWDVTISSHFVPESKSNYGFDSPPPIPRSLGMPNVLMDDSPEDLKSLNNNFHIIHHSHDSKSYLLGEVLPEMVHPPVSPSLFEPAIEPSAVIAEHKEEPPPIFRSLGEPPVGLADDMPPLEPVPDSELAAPMHGGDVPPPIPRSLGEPSGRNEPPPIPRSIGEAHSAAPSDSVFNSNLRGRTVGTLFNRSTPSAISNDRAIDVIKEMCSGMQEPPVIDSRTASKFVCFAHTDGRRHIEDAIARINRPSDFYIIPAPDESLGNNYNVKFAVSFNLVQEFLDIKEMKRRGPGQSF